MTRRPAALVTGGSRGIGAATALAFAGRGYDVAITYRNKRSRAEQVAGRITEYGVRALSIACDITRQDDVDRLFCALRAWTAYLNVVVLNASGGLERELVASDPLYPMRVNRDGQIAVVDGALPLMTEQGVIVFVTSHWAHLYGRVEQLPRYGPVAETKFAGEQALRARQEELAGMGLRLIVVTGDLVEGTITPKLLELAAPGLASRRQETVGSLPTAEEMGEAIAVAVVDTALPSGHTVVVGGSLDSLHAQ